MAVRSSSLTGEPRTFFNVPLRIVGVEAGRTAIVRSVIIANNTATARVIWLQWGDVESGADFYRLDLPASGSVVSDVWWVLPELVSLWIRSTTTGPGSGIGTVLVSGAYLDGVVE